MLYLIEGICGFIMLGAMIIGFYSMIDGLIPEKNSNDRQNNNRYRNSSTSPKPEDKYENDTAGIDETSNASFTDVVKEVVSDITGKSFENMDNPIEDDDDDDPIKFK